MIYLLLFIAIAGIVIVIITDDRFTKFLLASIVCMCSIIIGEESSKRSLKGFNVFPVYEISGNDTINTTWYSIRKQ